MKDRSKRSTMAGRSADARGETGTAADALAAGGHGRKAGGDGGGMPRTVDAGVSERVAGTGPASPIDRSSVKQATAAAAPAKPARKRRASEHGKASDEGPLESIGEAISAPVLGAPPEEKGEPAKRSHRKGARER